jgi:hypothetical protein
MTEANDAITQIIEQAKDYYNHGFFDDAIMCLENLKNKQLTSEQVRAASDIGLNIQLRKKKIDGDTYE